jgi:hypothetical protein
MRWVGHVAHLRERRVAQRVFVGKSEGKRPLARLRCRWEDNINVILPSTPSGVGGHGLD